MLSLLALAAPLIVGSGLLSVVITLVILGLIFWLVIWFVDWAGVPQPFNKVIKVIVGLIVLIYLINVLLGLAGHPLFG
jgi:hypothetical protein